MKFLDAHVHLWDTDVFELAWLRNAPDLAPKYSLSQTESSTQGQFICVQAGESLAEARWLIEQAQQYPQIAAVVLQYGPSEVPGAWAGSVHEALMDSMLDDGPVAGVRVPARGAPDNVEEIPGLDQLCVELGANSLVLEWLIRPSQLPSVTRLAQRHPQLPMILCHMGIGTDPIEDGWVESLASIAECPNVFTKISGILSPIGDSQRIGAPAAIIRAAINSFGAERMIFGSDWPMTTRTGRTYDAVVQAVEEILAECSIKQPELIFGGTARAVYGLGESEQYSVVTSKRQMQTEG